MTDELRAQDQGAASFLFEMGLLKRSKRTGWWTVGVKDPESIAEHSWRTAIVGTVLAMREGADPAKVTMMCAWHDTQETRVGDIPWVGRRYLTAAANAEVTADQLAAAHPEVAAGVQAVIDEYEEEQTLEAVVAHDADKLECMIQGLEYLRQGHSGAQEWIDSVRAVLKTESAIQIAEAAFHVNPLDWQRTFKEPEQA